MGGGVPPPIRAIQTAACDGSPARDYASSHRGRAHGGTWLGGADRRAHTDSLGRCAARRAPEGDQRPGYSRLAYHDLDKGEELDRHAEFADWHVPAADPAPLRGIPSADGRTREGS